MYAYLGMAVQNWDESNFTVSNMRLSKTTLRIISDSGHVGYD